MGALLVTLAVAALIGGFWAGARGIRLVARALREADHPDSALWLIRGLRGLIVWICLTGLVLGAVLEQAWLLVFAGLWLLEEIYETRVLALILRTKSAGARLERRPHSATRRRGRRRLALQGTEHAFEAVELPSASHGPRGRRDPDSRERRLGTRAVPSP